MDGPADMVRISFFFRRALAGMRHSRFELIAACIWCSHAAALSSSMPPLPPLQPLLIGGRAAAWQCCLSVLPYSSSFLPSLDPKFSQTSKPNLPNSFKQTLFHLLIWNFPNKAT
jgi:hypothetical protein